ncbi:MULTISPECIES: hypothetical protein [Cupriavidus]
MQMIIGEIETDLAREAASRFRITHHYDIGNQDVYVERATGEADGRRAALYCWFKACEWFGESAIVSDLGIASMLVTFYGFQHCAASNISTTVDLYADAEGFSDYAALMRDESLFRDGLQKAMRPHVTV